MNIVSTFTILEDVVVGWSDLINNMLFLESGELQDCVECVILPDWPECWIVSISNQRLVVIIIIIVITLSFYLKTQYLHICKIKILLSILGMSFSSEAMMMGPPLSPTLSPGVISYGLPLPPHVCCLPSWPTRCCIWGMYQ